MYYSNLACMVNLRYKKRCLKVQFSVARNQNSSSLHFSINRLVQKGRLSWYSKNLYKYFSLLLFYYYSSLRAKGKIGSYCMKSLLTASSVFTHFVTVEELPIHEEAASHKQDLLLQR